jgi:hypothetical protein
MTNDNLYLINGKLYYTDWREQDLRQFWSITMNEDVYEGICEGAKLMGHSRAALTQLKPKEW